MASFALDAPRVDWTDEPATDPATVKAELVRCLVTEMGRDPDYASPQDWFCALVYYVRGRAIASQIRTSRRTINAAAKIVYYLSLEVLPGRLLKANLLSLGLLDTCKRVLASLDVDLDELWELEVEPPLGNGGLGRLAACMLDSLASQSYAAFGYGIRYEYG